MTHSLDNTRPATPPAAATVLCMTVLSFWPAARLNHPIPRLRLPQRGRRWRWLRRS